MTDRQIDFDPSDTERDRLAALTDHLIAGGAGMPAASDAEVHSTWLRRALAARPDLVPVVQDVISRDGAPGDVLDALRRDERDTFDAFAFIVAGAYLINPRIRQLLGYPGPVPAKNPAFPDEAESYLEDGILDVVIKRGPIYRSTPQD